MADDFASKPDSPTPKLPRRFVYRRTKAEAESSHPLRRSTDLPQAFQGQAGNICPEPLFVKMRVYLKVN